MTRFQIFGVAGACVLLTVLVCSCTVIIPGGHGRRHGHPPAHAPAYGRRGMHTYVYYPSSYVYFDSARGTYFYMAGGVWKATVTLPSHISISVSEGISLRLETAKPYEHFHTHKGKYPRGQLKKGAGKRPGKGKGRKK